MRKYETDVLIAGSGVAGLYCALHLKSDLKVLVLSKSELTKTNTYLAQGGISTALNDEDMPLFVEDTMKAGDFENTINAVNVLVQESRDNIDELLGYGLQLERNNGELSYTREGAHSVNRIVHQKDETGKAVADTLIAEAKKRNNIELWEYARIVDVMKKGNLCVGGVIVKDGEIIEVSAKALVLATGGVGGLFKKSTSQRDLTGDGVAIALKNGIKLKDSDYIQFHPTVLHRGAENERRFLISESLRGEGAKLYNSKGERFVDELLPRDEVTAIIEKELEKTGDKCVYLDISFLDSDYVKKRFPSIYKECLKSGIDITKDRVPVSPAQHYYMGGIEVDLNGKTSMENLYALGETACTGVHGKNRLASNSLLEGLVFARRAAALISKTTKGKSAENTEGSSYTMDVDKQTVIRELKRGGKFKDELFSD
ncbi:MAG: L-aspartate oxidase [Clostridiaceae bacterium]